MLKHVLVASVLLATGGAASAQVVYGQSGSEACNPSCWTSATTNGLNGFRAFDNFGINTTTSIGSVSWQGIYIPTTAQATAPTPNTQSWNIGFYADAGLTPAVTASLSAPNANAAATLPGAQIYSATLNAADVTTTQVGTGTFGSQAVNIYAFSAVLPTAFTAVANTSYWFSPQSNQADFSPFFSWSPATTDVDGVSAQTQDSGAPYTRPNDRAFALNAVGDVPEPATWGTMLLGFGVVGLGLRRRRTAAFG